ncbi:hypothetical protein A9Q90_02710 [Gammaproteobacteria bacterium 54_18_T64]|nr:hypothetical protein A9Q90_02710 [Gammaproteobacteria bacterium 54_18_T64]
MGKGFLMVLRGELGAIDTPRSTSWAPMTFDTYCIMVEKLRITPQTALLPWRWELRLSYGVNKPLAASTSSLILITSRKITTNALAPYFNDLV